MLRDKAFSLWFLPFHLLGGWIMNNWKKSEAKKSNQMLQEARPSLQLVIWFWADSISPNGFLVQPLVKVIFLNIENGWSISLLASVGNRTGRLLLWLGQCITSEDTEYILPVSLLVREPGICLLRIWDFGLNVMLSISITVSAVAQHA